MGDDASLETHMRTPPGVKPRPSSDRRPSGGDSSARMRPPSGSMKHHTSGSRDHHARSRPPGGGSGKPGQPWSRPPTGGSERRYTVMTSPGMSRVKASGPYAHPLSVDDVKVRAYDTRLSKFPVSHLYQTQLLLVCVRVSGKGRNCLLTRTLSSVSFYETPCCSLQPPTEDISLEMLHSMLQTSHLGFHSNKQRKQELHSTVTGAGLQTGTIPQHAYQTDTFPPRMFQTGSIHSNMFLRPNSAFRDKVVPGAKANHVIDAYISAPSAFERSLWSNDSTNENARNRLNGPKESGTLTHKAEKKTIANGHVIKSKYHTGHTGKEALYREVSSCLKTDRDVQGTNRQTGSSTNLGGSTGHPFLQVIVFSGRAAES